MTVQDSFTDLTLQNDYVPAALIERHLHVAIRTPAARPELYAALLSAKVYMVRAEPVLGEAGPAVLLPIEPGERGPVLRLYTGRSRLPAGSTDEEVSSLPFSMIVSAVQGVEIVLDAGTSSELRLPAAHVQLLRELS